MKKIVTLLTLTLLVCIAAANAYGQKEAREDLVSGLLDVYEDKEGVESITISSSLLAMMENGTGQDKQTKELISKIKDLRVLIITDAGVEKALLAELEPVLQNTYTQIMKVKKSAKERMMLYLRTSPEKSGKKQAGALLVTIAEDNSLTVMYLSGNVDTDLIDAVLSGKVNVMNGKINALE
ncbi:MAG: DUF4252 domain-containing protein [Prevotellaceae bacterium]|jgi:hypothetical protein|nr:DUF4252 domain-containing protein [Prevotellaceae bacterium]